jgi:hypothetical protein
MMSPHQNQVVGRSRSESSLVAIVTNASGTPVRLRRPRGLQGHRSNSSAWAGAFSNLAGSGMGTHQTDRGEPVV